VNLDELELETCGESIYRHQYGVICARIGAKKLGYNLTVLSPGQRANFYHNHHVNEEMFFILEGAGLLRFGNRDYPLRKDDIIACPPGGRDVAHQIINQGSEVLKFIALSTKEPFEIAEFPDSDKLNVVVGDYSNLALVGAFKMSSKVSYHDGEGIEESRKRIEH
jgi:uncharacterized cupin superfamily protein